MPHTKTRFVLAGMVVLLMPACSYGPTVDQFPPAQQPGGVTATLVLGSDTLTAEVLAVEEDALFVLAEPSTPHRLAGKLARIPFSGITRGEFAHAGGFRHNFFHYLVAYGREDAEPYEATGADLAAGAAGLDNVRLLSRYPQGVSEELLARLEEAYGKVETVDPGGER